MHKLKKHFSREKAPKGLTFEKFLESLEGYQDRSRRRIYTDREKTVQRSYRGFFIAGMHFMDAYNFSVERVKRCVIHYPDPKGHLYPFCAYNALGYRRRVEERHKHTPEELKEKYIKEGRPMELEKIAKKLGI